MNSEDSGRLEPLDTPVASASPIDRSPQGPPSPFAALGLSAPLVRAVAAEGYEQPTPIQTQSIPYLLQGRDLLGCAQTGTGKTAAFVLPMLQHLAGHPNSGKVRALVLTPTRELAAQIDERASAYGRHVGVRHAVIFGGVSQRGQERELDKRPDLLVATPGRLLDLMNQKLVRLEAVEIFVLDEADRMLDMGFIYDVKRIISALPKKRQTLLFSATLPQDIGTLAKDILRDPIRVSAKPPNTTVELVEQSVYFVSRGDKRALLEKIIREEQVTSMLVFTKTKRGANRVSEQLVRAGIEAAAIHGNKSQGARTKALESFRAGHVTVLVATDIAARGIDVEGISHVVNYDLPNVAESYVHRIGRTGRAGAAGRAVAFCDRDERGLLADIEKLIRQRIPVAGTIAPTPGAASEEARPRSPGPWRSKPHGRPQQASRPQSGARPQPSSNGWRPQGGAPSKSSWQTQNGPRPQGAGSGQGQRADGGPSGAPPARARRNRSWRPTGKRY